MMILLLISTALASEIIVGQDAPTVQEAVDMAVAGDVVVLPDGRWAGPATISKPITITSRGGILVGSGGTTLRIDGPGAVVSMLKVEGSGNDLRGPDSCVFVATSATGAQIRDSHLTDCLFGIWAQDVAEVHIARNEIFGRADVPPSSKGNGIHLHNASRMDVRGNTVNDARDGIYVSATEDSVIIGNTVSNQRFGIHYMYSYRNQIIGNVANGNSGGIALMQSRDLVVTGNIANDNKRHGILFRDTLDSLIDGNTVARNAEGFFFFSSVRNRILENTVHSNNIGMRVWAGTIDNEIKGNNLINNRQHVFYVASEDQTWGSNYWSDYLGWDQNSDGYGDRVYRNEAFSARMLHRFPQAVLLLSSPTLEILSNVQSRVPTLRTPSVVDIAPLMRPKVGEEK
jgi:nitrous oxidase accessory protein